MRVRLFLFAAPAWPLSVCLSVCRVERGEVRRVCAALFFLKWQADTGSPCERVLSIHWTVRVTFRFSFFSLCVGLSTGREASIHPTHPRTSIICNLKCKGRRAGGQAAPGRLWLLGERRRPTEGAVGTTKAAVSPRSAATYVHVGGAYLVSG